MRRRHPRIERVLLVGQVDDGQDSIVVAAEESGPEVETVGDEGVGVRDDGHAADALELGLLVGVVDLGAVGVVGGSVGGVVVDDEDVDEASDRVSARVLQRIEVLGYEERMKGCWSQSSEDGVTYGLCRNGQIGLFWSVSPPSTRYRDSSDETEVDGGYW